MAIQESSVAAVSGSNSGQSPGNSSASIVSFRLKSDGKVQMQDSLKKTPDAAHFAALLHSIATKRDRAAFIEVFEYFAPRVKSFLLGQGVAPAAADDVLQEVMLAVWNKAKLFDPKKAAPSTWIFAIARNKRIDRIRRETKPELDPEEPSLQPGAEDAADDAVMDTQRKTAVAEALSELPPDQRICVELSFMKGLSHGEIAEHLGLPLGTVKSRIRLAFGRLRNELGDLK